MKGISKRTRSCAAAAAFAAALLGGGASHASDAASEIWLAPLQPAIGADGGQWGATDYFEALRPETPWGSAGTAIRVFKIYPGFARDAPDAELLQVAKGLAARHIALALETSILIELENCTPGVAKYDGVVSTVARLKRLGIDLSFIAMTGPLVDGHTHAAPAGCRAPIKAVAADAAATIRRLEAIYPELKFGDIEPVGHAPGYLDWQDLAEWLADFKQATGSPLAFLHIDVTWGNDWRSDLVHVASTARDAGVPLGVIFDGDSSELSDADWSSDVERNYLEVEKLIGPKLDQAVFQSWAPYPHHLLPETSPTSMLGDIQQYLRPRSRLEALSPHEARLTGESGAPIAGAEILAQRADAGLRGMMRTEEIDGTVPHGVADALFALRVRSECNCAAAPTILSIADFQFGQEGSPFYRSDLREWAGRWRGVIRLDPRAEGVAIDIDARADQKLVLNGAPFPIVPDTPFRASFRWHVGDEAEETGYAAIIFRNSAGIEQHRILRWIQATWLETARARTNAQGVATFAAAITRPVEGEKSRLKYEGDHEHRPVVAPAEKPPD